MAWSSVWYCFFVSVQLFHGGLGLWLLNSFYFNSGTDEGTGKKQGNDGEIKKRRQGERSPDGEQGIFGVVLISVRAGTGVDPFGSSFMKQLSCQR